ncbi:U-box domain-containing protein 26 [Rhynchospora pubera]|uniref:U-box domain-containing protein n=1 Tax=Rhynchospora pubera TaxID=906938 RepID=A0AAV8FDG0_9POAL|nr:U-box domain-containing protein 26 [Rhynchospora pubera]
MPGSISPLPLDLSTLQIPWYFRCPISLELMRDPVTVCTGQTYDRASIESWVATGNTTCPVTRAPLSDFTLIPNHTLRRLIQEWCVANRSFGIERIPTPKQPAEPDHVRILLAQAGSGGGDVASRAAAVRRLRALARESEKNRVVMATRETRLALLDIAFDGSGSGLDSDLESESMAVLAIVGLGESEAEADLAARSDRLNRLGEILMQSLSLEARINAGAVVEVCAAASSTARSALGETDGIIHGLVKLIEEKSNSRAVRIGIRGVFALCLSKENRARAVEAGAARAVVRKLGEVETERGAAAIELMCRVEGGREALINGAGGGPEAVAALVKAMGVGRAAEHAAGALVAIVSSSDSLQIEAVKAGAMGQLLLMVQGGFSDRAKRKAQVLLKLLRSAWPSHDAVSNSDGFLLQTF